MGMDLSSALHQQEMGTHQTLESMLVCPKTQQQLEEKKPRPQPTEAAALKCPRCESNNTKFCYYNNYSLSQPRYFCKSCKRYWTQGGTLRNVPVGGGCRKTKRPSPSSSSSSSASAIRSHDQPITAINPNPLSPLFPALTHDYYSSSDILGLAFAGLHNQSGTHYPNGFQNLYYGVGNGNLGRVENVGEETKQEIWNGRGEAESRGLWGIPWGINGSGEGNYIGDLDSSGRESWNGIGNSSSNWHGHGLVNGTLM